jgi:mRNA interferase YafQ
MDVFLQFKSEIPPRVLPAGFNDHALGDTLKGYRECHLAGDILLIYKLQNDTLSLLELCAHDDIKGGKEKATKKRLKNKDESKGERK